jgi:CheY-like chemotaxis protein
MVEQFRPDYVVIDSSLGQAEAQHLCRHLLEDSRIADVRVVMAANPGEVPDGCDKNVFARITKPFSAGKFAECISSAAAE